MYYFADFYEHFWGWARETCPVSAATAGLIRLMALFLVYICQREAVLYAWVRPGFAGKTCRK